MQFFQLEYKGISFYRFLGSTSFASGPVPERPLQAEMRAPFQTSDW